MKLEENFCSLAYVSGACNSNPFAADWSENNVICVAIGEGIGLLYPKLDLGYPGKLEKILFAHTERVNAVKWIRNLNNISENSFISASVDKTVIVWTCENDNFIPKYFLKGHTDAVTDVSAISFNLSNCVKCLLVATLSVDTLLIWKKNDTEDEFSLLDKYVFTEVGLGVSGISFSMLPGTESVILACSNKFINVSLYTSHSSFKKLNSHIFEEQSILTGHTNWINDLAFVFTDMDKTLLLASTSHDSTIRVWRIVQKEEAESKLNLREYTIFVENKRFSITINSILHGHDHWIYTLQWKYFENEDKEENKLKLLSVSADKSILIWKRDLTADTWTENYRLGNIGGNASVFLGGCFSPTGQYVMAHDLLGAFHVWKYNRESDNWISAVLPSGHSDEVTDIQWDPNGTYIVSSSVDKTTRLHAPWIKDSSYWYEFARPQTHGHIISCLTVLPDYRFVSGATEKELRSFIASKTFIKHLKKLSFMDDVDENKYPHNSAILPTLDLSNKPASEVDHAKIINSNSVKINGNDDIRDVLTEDELTRGTLWPEIQKLYYHPNEISCITSTRDGTLIASACKANNPKEASIVIWLINEWDKIKRIQELWFHQLTVTQLSFSPCGSYLLSVSRDRSWNLFKRNENENTFQSIAFTSKTNAIHKRQLNCCAWSHDSQYFATGSRDGKLVLWTEEKGSILSDNSSTKGYIHKKVLTMSDENISSVTFAPGFVNLSDYLIAVGLGSGKIGMFIWNHNTLQCRNVITFFENIAHRKCIMKLAFRPVFGLTGKEDNQHILQLASAGADKLVKIYNLNVKAI